MKEKKEAALNYAKEGWFVLPIWSLNNSKDCQCFKGKNCLNPGKHPIPEHGVNDATNDPKQIEHWWTEYPDANVAIATGKISSIIVIDIDPRNGGDFSLEKLEEDHGKLPDTLIARTGGGGKHLFFPYASHLNHKFRSKISGYPGIDILADGKYVVVEPSTHKNGGKYVFEL